jgi:hypothetical protein
MTVNPALISGGNGVGIAVSGSDLFVLNNSIGTIGEYTANGSTVNPALISGLQQALAIAVSGSDLFVSQFPSGQLGSGLISEYNATDGTPVNPDLITGLSAVRGIAVLGSDLFITEDIGGGISRIGEYTTNGSTVNPALIAGLTGTPTGIAIAPVPEPSTLAIFGAGLLGLAFCRRWRPG